MNVRLTYSYKGTAVEGERKFDDDKVVDQAFNVYLRHKKVTRNIKDTQEVTHTIDYKYVSADDVLANKRGTTAAPTLTEILHYERDHTIDYTVAPDGIVTFVPEKDFIGTASGALLVCVDTEGKHIFQQCFLHHQHLKHHMH